jgi:hypothetical protein
MTIRFRAVVVAAQKTGKTGSIAALANTGKYRIIVAAFDPGADVLYKYVTPENRDKVFILPYEDRRGFSDSSKIMVDVIGEAKAFPKFLTFLDTGKARRLEGDIVELGPAEDWGSDTILVVDNLTSLSKAAYAAYLSRRGKNRAALNRKDWGLAAAEVDETLITLTSSYFKFHVIVLAHWKIQGPRDWEDEDKSDPEKTDYNNEIRKREADLIPTKMVPISIGRQLSQNLTYHFPTVVWAEVTDDGKRIFNLKPTSVRDVGIPVKPDVLPDTLPIETGLLAIFNAVSGV